MRDQRLRHVGYVVAIVALFAVAVIGVLTMPAGPTDRAAELQQRLRCPTCKSVSIAESPAETALAMREAVDTQVDAGRSDDQIIGFFRARYGDWVLLDPPAKGSTLILWLLPLAALGVGVILLARQRHPPEPTPVLTNEQRQAVRDAVEEVRGTTTAGESELAHGPVHTRTAGLPEQRRDQALRDLLDLERQEADNEIPAEVAAQLRGTYELTAAEALADIEASNAAQTPAAARSPRRSWAPGLTRGWIAAYVMATAVALFGAVVLLPRYVQSRPEGGAVTGNEVIEQEALPPPTPRTRDLTTVPDAELQAMVEAGPSVLDTRLALANRYLANGDLNRASEHFGVALTLDPANPEVLAGAGWVLFKLGRIEPATRFIDQALGVYPDSQDALWYKANILLQDRRDAAGALDLLGRLAARADLDPQRRAEVERLIGSARGGPG